MFGFLGTPLGIPPSFAPASVAVPGDRATPMRRGTPAFALIVSGALHAAALALFLLVSARPGLEAVPTLKIRVLVDPGMVRVLTPPIRSAQPPSGPTDEGGQIQPVDPKKEIIREILQGLERRQPIPGDPTEPADRRVGSQGPPGYAPPTETDPNLPSEYDEPPVQIVAPEPRYPEFAREAGIEGRVVLKALVGRDGQVLQVVVMEGDRSLVDEAVKAVRVWKFRPARWNGKPVTAWVAIPILFRLH